LFLVPGALANGGTATGGEGAGQAWWIKMRALNQAMNSYNGWDASTRVGKLLTCFVISLTLSSASSRDIRKTPIRELGFCASTQAEFDLLLTRRQQSRHMCDERRSPTSLEHAVLRDVDREPGIRTRNFGRRVFSHLFLSLPSRCGKVDKEAGS
jgi:hypothetical protein